MEGGKSGRVEEDLVHRVISKRHNHFGFTVTTAPSARAFLSFYRDLWEAQAPPLQVYGNPRKSYSSSNSNSSSSPQKRHRNIGEIEIE